MNPVGIITEVFPQFIDGSFKDQIPIGVDWKVKLNFDDVVGKLIVINGNQFKVKGVNFFRGGHHLFVIPQQDNIINIGANVYL